MKIVELVLIRAVEFLNAETISDGHREWYNSGKIRELEK